MNKKTFNIILILAVLLMAFYPAISHAGWLFDATLEEVIEPGILTVNSIFIGFFGKLLAWSANIFESFIRWQDFEDVRVVKESWALIRDFVNMFFILILVIIAFGTILNIKGYAITSPGLLSKFLISALLINFSLAIGGLIIDISHVLSNVFLNSIGEFGGNLAAGLRLQDVIVQNPDAVTAEAVLKNVSADKVITATVLDSVFTLIVIAILSLSLLTAAVFAIVRVPILWALLIVSPAIWVLRILPFSQGLSKKWWDAFISWTFFLPAYLFILVIGTAILRNRSAIDALIPFQGEQASFASFGNFFVQNVFFYILAIMMLLGGLKASLNIGKLTSSGVGKVFGSVKGGVDRTLGVSAARTGFKQAMGRVQEEGVPRFKIGGWQPFRGAAGERERAGRFEERFARPFGLQPDFAAQKEFVSNSDKEVGSLKQQLNLNQIKVDDIQAIAKKFPVSSPRGFAARKVLADEGELGTSTYLQAANALADKNPFALQNLTKSWADKNFAKASPDDIIGMLKADPGGVYADMKKPGAEPARREMALKLSDDKFNKGVLKKIDYATFENAMTILRGADTYEGGKVRREVAKKRPDIVAQYDMAHPAPNKPRRRSLAGAIYDVIKGRNARDIRDILPETWERSEFKNALSVYIRTLEGRNPSTRIGAKVKLGSGRSLVESLKKQATDRKQLAVIISIERALPPI